MKNRVLPIILGVCCVLLAVSGGYIFVMRSEYNAHMTTCKTFSAQTNGEFIDAMLDANLPSVSEEYIEDIEITDKMALEIGDCILRETYGNRVVEEGSFEVYEVPLENVFVVTRQLDKVVGNKYSVAIDKSTGGAVRVWTY